LDATTVLSRGIAELGIYPAVDPLDSSSRILDANVIGQDHYDTARGVQKILQVGGSQGMESPAGCRFHAFCTCVISTWWLASLSLKLRAQFPPSADIFQPLLSQRCESRGGCTSVMKCI